MAVADWCTQNRSQLRSSDEIPRVQRRRGEGSILRGPPSDCALYFEYA